MSVLGWIYVYSAVIVAFSLFGGYWPMMHQVTHSRLQKYLSLSAGVMLGAAFFHVMPEALELAGDKLFGWSMALGVIGLFCIERFIAPHSHETSSKLQQDHDHEPGCEHDHQHHAAPAVAGWTAVLGLTVHTFMNGVGLAGAVQADYSDWNKGILFIPGLALFLAIVLHKPADALAISTVLSRKGVSRGRLTLVQIGFASMIPIGALAFYWTSGKLEQDMENKLIGAALAFSGGTFLFIALSDLLPEVQFHSHDRVPLFRALVFGVVFMGGIGILEDLGGGHHHNKDNPADVQDSDGDHDVDHDATDKHHHNEAKAGDKHHHNDEPLSRAQ